MTDVVAALVVFVFVLTFAYHGYGFEGATDLLLIVLLWLAVSIRLELANLD